MRYDRDHQERHEKALTLGELCQGIERRLIPSARQGDEYIVRTADVRRLREIFERMRDGGLEMAPERETSPLDVSRPA